VVLDEALALSERHKLFGFELRVRVSRLQSSDESVPAAMLERQLQDLEPFLSRAPRMVVAHAYYLKAQFWLERGDLQRAKALNTSARGAFERSSWQIAHVLTGLVDAEIECALGRYADARRSLAACDETLADLHIPFVRFCIGVVRALIVRHDEPARFAEILGETLALGRRQGFATTIYRRSPSLRRLLSSALELKIEPDYCRWLIRTRAWHPQAHESALWPWPVRIITLGGFHVSIEDRALATGGKAQQRPLNLLKATLAQRSGVDVGLVMEQLWPDLDGDSARNALDLALHRLRKLLKRPDAIVLTQGRLAVNPDEVWVDAHALDAYEVHELSAAALVDLMRLYRGPFLADEDDAWMFAPRERLRSRFLRLVGELALRLEAEARNEVLGDLYRRALEVEPLAEELYRGYMQCLMRQGRHTEAAATYRRCKETLARSLNVIPSPLTQSLYAQLPGSN
jgi:DNA-binding SARP family transcriptional activator